MIYKIEYTETSTEIYRYINVCTIRKNNRRFSVNRYCTKENRNKWEHFKRLTSTLTWAASGRSVKVANSKTSMLPQLHAKMIAETTTKTMLLVFYCTYYSNNKKYSWQTKREK